MIKFVKLHENASIPEYKSKLAAGADIVQPADGILQPGIVTMVGTGLQLAECPENLELQIRMRSGKAKAGLMLANSIGTIDADYRGEICLLIYNTLGIPFSFSAGDRLVQIVPALKIDRIPMEWADTASETERGAGGFGSSGV